MSSDAQIGLDEGVILDFKIDGYQRHIIRQELAAGDFAKLVELLEDAIVGSSGKADDSEKWPTVSISDIGDGSVRIGERIRAFAASAVVSILAAVQSGDYGNISIASHKKLKELSDFVIKKKLACSLSIGTGSPSLISADNPVPVVKVVPMRVRKNLYGRLVRVGGVAPVAVMELVRGGGNARFDVTMDVAKELGKKLYDTIGVAGTAIVDARTNSYLSFAFEKILPYRGESANPASAMRDIEDAMPGVWKYIDIDKFVAGLRDEEDD